MSHSIPRNGKRVIAPYVSDTDWNATTTAFIAADHLRTTADPRPTGAIAYALAT